MKWLISVPVWGERYRRQFVEQGLPAVRAALDHAGLGDNDVLWVIHTDDPEFLGNPPSIDGWIMWKPVPPGKNSSEQLGNAARAALAEASPGECVMFHNSDVVLSREAFSAAEKRFAEGKIFFTCHSVRTVNGNPPPVGDRSRDLLSWAWKHHHPWVDDCIYGSGHVAGPAIVVFETPSEQNVVAHCFSLLCLAVHKTRDIRFTGPTCDEMIDAFEPHEVHIVQDADEMACVEPSAADIPYDKTRSVVSERRIRRWLPAYASAMMLWQFRHQIVIKGHGLKYAQKIADDIYAKADRTLIPARLALDSQGRLAHWKRYGWYGRLMRVPRPLRRLVPRFIRREVLQWIGVGSV
jgi:hypothetical protein